MTGDTPSWSMATTIFLELEEFPIAGQWGSHERLAGMRLA